MEPVDKKPLLPSREKVYQILAGPTTLSGFFKFIDAAACRPYLSRKRRHPSASPWQEWTLRAGKFSLAGEVLLEPNGLNFNVKFSSLI